MLDGGSGVGLGGGSGSGSALERAPGLRGHQNCVAGQHQIKKRNLIKDVHPFAEPAVGPFELTKEMVARLDDIQLRVLLGHLLTAEARRYGISEAGIYIGGHQNAADGGVDAVIGWADQPAKTDYLPRQRVYFQSKAESMPPAEVGKEMRPGGKPRPIFDELALVDGAYVIFSTDDPSKSALDDRLAAMRQAVAGITGSDRIFLDFYGAEKIARWANQHLGVALEALKQSGRVLGGWRPYGDWSAPGAAGQPYVLDETPRVTLRGETVDVRAAIVEIRTALAKPGGVVRLVGLSGMGKTRLSEALFDDRIEPHSALPQFKAIYGDSSAELSASSARVAEELALAGADAIVIVDNCASRSHNQLAEIASRPGSRISLLTIDYDVSGDPCPGLQVALHESAEAVLAALLEQRHPSLSNAERQHLATFSGGNSRIALKIAEGAEEGVDLSKLNDTELLDRLFRAERQGLDPYSRICAEAAALVYAFYVEAADYQEPEHRVLAGIAEVSVDTFFRNVAMFLDWGIVQKRGPQRAVMPPPLANMLAAPFIRRSDPSTLLHYFEKSPPRLLASFARRLGQLHDEPAAVQLARRLLTPGGAFAELAGLDDITRRGFVNIAPAAPEAALDVFERALRGPQRKSLLDPTATGHQDYCHVLVHLAHEQPLFSRALDILLTFATADGNLKDEPPARKHFLERFWFCLSFTKADQDTRLDVIDRLLDDPSPTIREIGLDALDHMLEAGSFTSSMNIEFGAKARLREWRPQTREAVLLWYRAAYERVIRLASTDTPTSARARDIVAHHLRQHIDADLADIAFDAIRRLRRSGYWDAGWRAVAEVLHFGRGTLGPDVEAALVTLEEDLRPKSIQDCFDAFVLGEPWRHWHPRRNKRAMTRNVSRLATAVGVRLSRSCGDPQDLLFAATSGKHQSSIWYFGRGIALAGSDITKIWSMAYEAYRKVPPANRSPDLLIGILSGSHRRHPHWVEERLDASLTDPLLAEHIVLLQCAVPLGEAAVTRLEGALSAGKVPVRSFARLAMGKTPQSIDAPALARLLLQIFEAEGGISTSILILRMRIFGDQQDKNSIDDQITRVAQKILTDPRSYSQEMHTHGHDLKIIASCALGPDNSKHLAQSICHTIMSVFGERHQSPQGFESVFNFITKRHPEAVLDAIILGKAPDPIVEAFLFGNARHKDDEEKSQISIGDDFLIKWAKEDPAIRAPRLARFIPYSRPASDTGSLSWSPLALDLIAAAPCPVEILRAFEFRFGLGAGWGPFSARFVRCRPLVAAMLEHPDLNIRTWARMAGRSLEASITRWDERDRAADTRFE